MSLSIGIVGLPNVGKSTLFNALTKKQVPAENFPFCTIAPNVGVVKVPDFRLEELGKSSCSKQIIPAAIEFVDIAGLVRGASKGEGLGNKFLANIREVDAICQVVRDFVDDNIVHVQGKINPKEDVETINLELILADLETVNKKYDNLKRLNKGSITKTDAQALVVIEKIKTILEQGKLAISLELTPEEKLLIKDLNLLTIKPMIYVVNVAEKDINKNISLPNIEQKSIIPMCIKLEAELADLPDNEVKEYLDTLGLKDTCLDRLIKTGYDILNLITFFTSGEKETRAWTVNRGDLAPQAAGKIHTDFEKGFIVAETIFWQDLLSVGGWVKAKEKGLVRTEGRSYEVKDGDVMIFRFN